jgi:hypothetical protein
MSFGLTSLARAVVIGVFLIPAKGYSQPTLANGPLKEVQIAADAFSLADPLPSWVDSIAIPEASEPQPVVIRLADTQFLVSSTPVVYVRRALMVNDAASLSSAGQLAIPFVPQYQTFAASCHSCPPWPRKVRPHRVCANTLLTARDWPRTGRVQR